jgi:hypothetical protein
MLSVIFAQKAEIEKKNEENRWSREELRLERIPLQVLDVEGYIVANRLLGLLRRK